MTQERWQLTGSGAETYERYQVPSVFEPLARAFVEHLGLRAGERVLDVACGTGIIARVAAGRMGTAGSIVGVDLNRSMLGLARSLAPNDGPKIEWEEGDAVALRWPNDEFDVVLCQQGLQFFPDKASALREMHRVLKPSGRLGLAVWRSVSHSPCHLAVGDALGRWVGPEATRRFQVPFSFGDADALEKVIADAGFQDIDIEVHVVMRHLLPAEESIPALVASTPVGPDLVALPETRRNAIVAEAAAALQRYQTSDGGFDLPQPTHFVRARK